MSDRHPGSRRVSISRLRSPAPAALIACALTTVLSGCAGPGAESDEDTETASLAAGQVQDEGKRLFEQETFGGNGRTCLTCHGEKTGTISPREAEERFDDDPNDPLFLLDGSDDFLGHGNARMREHATVLVRMRLPAGVTLAGDPSATAIVVRRGVPTTLNSPALDPIIMLDGRAPSLEGQARGAIRGHAQATVDPTDAQIGLLVGHERSDAFFSSPELRDFARGGPAPELPEARSASQQRGRMWFVDGPVGPAVSTQSPRTGLCAGCHSGPMLNQTNGFFAIGGGTIPAGKRFGSVLVAELNHIGNPVFDFVVPTITGAPITVSTPDPGRALIDGNFTPSRFGQTSRFKIPSLWDVRRTAPYFHDNSRETLEDVVEHYATFFATITAPEFDGDAPLVMTAQDKKDIVAFLKLL